jgi:hypothetical protein
MLCPGQIAGAVTFSHFTRANGVSSTSVGKVLRRGRQGLAITPVRAADNMTAVAELDADRVSADLDAGAPSAHCTSQWLRRFHLD